MNPLKRKRVSRDGSRTGGGLEGPSTLGWEEVQCLVDGDQRPIIWTRNNIVLTAHPTNPIIIGRVPSTTTSPSPPLKFTLPLPDPIVFSRVSYSPATHLLTSPCSQYIFAYFPKSSSAVTAGLEGVSTGVGVTESDEGLGCVWERGAEVDAWAVGFAWGFGRGEGVVGGTWVGERRDWYSSPSPSSSNGFTLLRPPTSGPALPPAPTSSTLLLLLRSSHLHLLTHHPPSPTYFTTLRLPLSLPSSPSPNLSHPTPLPTKHLLHTALHPVPSSSLLLLATHSRLLPPPPPLPSLDPISASLMDPTFEQPKPTRDRMDRTNSEEFNGGLVIELAELRLNLLSVPPTLTLTPLPPLHPPTPPTSHLTHLSFIPLPPLPPSKPNSTTKEEELEESVFTPPESAVERTEGADEEGAKERSERFGLLASFLDSSRHDTPPTSTLRLYTLSRSAPQLCSAFIASDDTSAQEKYRSAAAELTTWIPVLSATRRFESHVLNLLVDTANAWGGKVLVGLVGNGRVGRARVGELRWVVSETLEDDADTRAVILGSKGYIPLSASASPNNLFISLASPSHAPPTTSLVPYPSPISISTSPTSPANTNTHTHTTSASATAALALSFLNTSDPDDVARALWSGGHARKEDVCVAVGVAWDVLDGVVAAGAEDGLSVKSDTSPPRKTQDSELLSLWVSRMVQTLVAIYKASPNPEIARAWETCSDITRLYACERAFSLCRSSKEDSFGRWTYELKNVWQLAGYTSWYLTLCKRLVADAIVDRAWELWETEGESVDAPEDDPGPSSSAILLIHPYPLALMIKILNHVQDFHGCICRYPAVPAAYIVRNAIQDVIDRAFLDLQTLSAVLCGVEGLLKSHIAESPRAHEELRETLITMSVPASLAALSRSIARLITTRDKLANKLAILVSPSDLVHSDTSANTNTSEPKADSPKDVISQTNFRTAGQARTCLRCGGKAEKISRTKASVWTIFEEGFATRCVCGGQWTNL